MIAFKNINKTIKNDNKNDESNISSNNFEGYKPIINPDTFSSDFEFSKKYAKDFLSFFRDGNCVNLPMFSEPPEPKAVKRINTELNLTISSGVETKIAFLPHMQFGIFFINGTQQIMSTVAATECFSTYKVVAATIKVKQVGILSVSDGYGTIMDAVIIPPTSLSFLSESFLNIQTGPGKKITMVDGRDGITASFIGSTLYPPMEDYSNTITNINVVTFQDQPVGFPKPLCIPAFSTVFQTMSSSSLQFRDPYNQLVDVPSYNPTVITEDIVSVNYTGTATVYDEILYQYPYGEMFYLKISPPSINVSIKIYIDYIVEGKTKPQFSVNMPQIVPPQTIQFDKIRFALTNLIKPLAKGCHEPYKTGYSMLKGFKKGKQKGSSNFQVEKNTVISENTLEELKKISKFVKKENKKFKQKAFELSTNEIKISDFDSDNLEEASKEIDQLIKNEEGKISNQDPEHPLLQKPKIKDPYETEKDFLVTFEDGNSKEEKEKEEIFANDNMDVEDDNFVESPSEAFYFFRELSNMRSKLLKKLDSENDNHKKQLLIFEIKQLYTLLHTDYDIILDFYKGYTRNKISSIIFQKECRDLSKNPFFQECKEEVENNIHQKNLKEEDFKINTTSEAIEKNGGKKKEKEKEEVNLEEKDKKKIGYCMMDEKVINRNIAVKTNVVLNKKKKLPNILKEASLFLSFPVSQLRNSPLTNRLFRDASTPWPDFSYQYFPIIDEDGIPQIGIVCVKKGAYKNFKKVSLKVPNANNEIKTLNLYFNPDNFKDPNEFIKSLSNVLNFLYSYAFHYVPDESYSINIISDFKLKDISYTYALLMAMYGAPSGGFYTGSFECDENGKYEVSEMSKEVIDTKVKLAKPDAPLMVLAKDAVDGDFINIVAGVVPDFQQGSMICTNDLRIAIIYGLLPFTTRTIKKTPYSEYKEEDVEAIMKDLTSYARQYIVLSNIRKPNKFYDFIDKGINKWKTFNRADPAQFTNFIVIKGKYVTTDEFYKNRKDLLDKNNGWYYYYKDTLFVEDPKFRSDIRTERFSPSVKIDPDIKKDLDLKNEFIKEITEKELNDFKDKKTYEFKNVDPQFDIKVNMYQGTDNNGKEELKNKIEDAIGDFARIVTNVDQFIKSNKPIQSQPVKKLFKSAAGGNVMSLLALENKVRSSASTDGNNSLKMFEHLAESVSPVAPIYLLQLIIPESYRDIVDPQPKVLKKLLDYLINYNNKEIEDKEVENEYSENKVKEYQSKRYIKKSPQKNYRRYEEEDKKEESNVKKKIGKKFENYDQIDFDFDEQKE